MMDAFDKGRNRLLIGGVPGSCYLNLYCLNSGLLWDFPP
jgi:hypothetical protein